MNTVLRDPLTYFGRLPRDIISCLNPFLIPPVRPYCFYYKHIIWKDECYMCGLRDFASNMTYVGHLINPRDCGAAMSMLTFGNAVQWGKWLCAMCLCTAKRPYYGAYRSYYLECLYWLEMRLNQAIVHKHYVDWAAYDLAYGKLP